MFIKRYFKVMGHWSGRGIQNIIPKYYILSQENKMYYVDEDGKEYFEDWSRYSRQDVLKQIEDSLSTKDLIELPVPDISNTYLDDLF